MKIGLGKLLHLVVLLAIAGTGGSTYAQSNYRFRNFTINDGLSQSSVTSIIQDNVGTLWIGTQDGLNRFDGHQFQIFTSEDTPGLQSQYINCSFQDSKGFLWFGTSNGLSVFNPKQEKFETYNVSKKTVLSIEDIVESHTGVIYVATSTQGLALLDKPNKKLVPVSGKIPSKRIHKISFLNDRLLLVSSEDKGVFTFNTVSKEVKTVPTSKSIKGTWVINDVELFANSTYLLSTNKGLWFYDYKYNACSPFLRQIERDYEINEITDVFFKSTSEFYVGTANKGLLTVKKNGGQYEITVSHQDIFQKNALLYDEITTLFKDKNGVIWVGTQRGLSCFDPENQGFLGVGPSGNTSLGLPSESVWGFAESPDGIDLFVATDVGVSYLNRRTGLFEQFYLPKDNDEARINCLNYVSDHELLVGTSNGMYTLRFSGPAYEYKKIEFKGLANEHNFANVYRILKYAPNEYYLATKGGVLYYNTKTKEHEEFVYSAKNPKKTIAPGICRVAYKDRNGIVYFATSSGGLSVLRVGENGKRTIVPFKHNAAILKLVKDYISCIYDDEDGNLWLGTSGSGLLHIDKLSGKTELFTKKNGLSNNFIYGITEDDAGNLWLSTNKGLCRFSKTKHTVTVFTEVNGLMSNEFNTGAYLNSVTGTMYFGGITGYNFFVPTRLDNRRDPLDVRFIKFKLDNKWLRPGDKDAPFTTAFSETQRIELPYNQRSFTIRFLSSDLMNPELIEYKYKLIGSDEGEIYLGNSTDIRFNSLSPGSYILEVYGRRIDGQWDPNPARMEIEVASPFWKKWWFLVSIALFLVIIIRWIVRSRIDLARREQVRLEMKIVERTKEIRAQNTKIESQKQIIEEEKLKVEEQKRLLQIEKDKSEKLLRNIIPESTAEELKNKGRASARAYKTVSVLFTDFVGFTKIAEGLKPTELVNKLDVYFRKFDEIIVRNNLEKIKTIGDADMCAGGFPVRNNTNPIDAVLAALQIQDYMMKLQHDAVANGTEYWELRLGIHTGEVTAGVIGSERLAYDIWGATVNQAQRMEMMGEPGRVTISGATFNLIEPYFECTFRGKVQSKSKGLIDMFTVERIKPELSINGEGLYPNDRFQQIVNLHLYSSINYYKAERHIMKVLEKGLSSKLHYHSIAHTKDVVRAVERYALLEGVTDEGLFLLKSAATYHDAGFVENYEKNEPIGARMAEEILPKYGYSEQHIAQIKELIFVTQIPHQPKNHLEEIICDADLDYLGRDDFHEIADKLRRELREHGKIDSDRKWDEMQVAFLNMHRYFTPTAIASRQTKKMKNLQEVMDRLERNEYKD